MGWRPKRGRTGPSYALDINGLVVVSNSNGTPNLSGGAQPGSGGLSLARTALTCPRVVLQKQSHPVCQGWLFVVGEVSPYNTPYLRRLYQEFGGVSREEDRIKA